MTIYFTAKTNKDYVMINTAKFTLPNGDVLTIDRNSTEYSIDENGNLEMEWDDCYLWAINGCHIFDGEAYIDNIFELSELLENSMLEFELEDDADEDYEVTEVEWSL